MPWNKLVSSLREKLGRGAGQGNGHQIPVAEQRLRTEQLGSAPLNVPLVDVYENDQEFLIHADVPGGLPEEAVVAWDDVRGLTLLMKSQALPSGVPWASEYLPHDWYRVFEFPSHVDVSKATSTCKDGVLTIRVPKSAAAALQFIPVKAA